MKRIEFLFTAVLLLLFALPGGAQNITVSGNVVDTEGVPLIGATVMVENTNNGTNTDIDGHYSLTVPSDARLVFSIIGYATVTEEVKGRKQISVIMKEDTEFLDATIVIGYGSGQKIGNIVGSVTTVSSDELADRPSANIGDALQGKVAGLQIFNTSGEPQSSVSIRLRGESSLNLSTEPLYILDGVPVSSGVFTSLNPQDIENISVLKDASSTAIYGSRAANGVIFISTKKGKMGQKPSISIRGQYGVSMLTNYNMDMMNSEELFRFEEICVPSLKDDVAYQARKAFILGNDINFDWTSYLFDQAAPVIQADASIRGASERTNYYVSLGYYSEQGTAKANSGVDRFTFRTNLDTQITNWLKFGANVALTYSKYSTIVTGWFVQSPILQAVTKQPYYTPYDYIFNEDGTISYGDAMLVYPWDNDIDLNYYYKYNTNNKQNMNLMGQTYFVLTPIEGLTIRAQQAIDGYDYVGESINMPSYTPYTYRGRNSQAMERYYQLSSTNTAEYRKDWNQEHFMSVLLGHESFIKYDKNFSAVGEGLSDDRIPVFGATTEISDWSGDIMECAFNSFFLNANYSYADRYFFDASIRTDGSSLFGKNHKYALFYSVGALWKIKNEKFLRNVEWVDDLNLHLSYGTTGNAGLGSWYASLGLVGTGSKYNGEQGKGLAQVPNEDLTWETVATLNLRLGGRIFDRLTFGIEFYDKASYNLLMDLPFSATTGHSSSMGNIASLVNRGVDIDFQLDLIHTRNFYWGISANVNYNKNKITKLYQDLDELAFPSYSLKYQVGYPSSYVFAPVRAGVDPADGSPMWYDINGNLTKNYSDDLMQFCGMDTNSPWSGGFSTNFSWKGLGVNADFSWIGERWIFLNERFYTMNPTNQLFRSNFETKMLNIWTEPGQITDIPKYGTQFYHDTSRFSNASFLRLKNLSVSYAFPKDLMDKTKVLSGLKVYVTARNLMTVTNFEGYDPEVGASNATSGMYPNSRQFVFGAELVF